MTKNTATPALDDVNAEITSLRATVTEWEARMAQAQAQRDQAGAERNELAKAQKTKDRLDHFVYLERVAVHEETIYAANRELSEGSRIIRGDSGFYGARYELRRLEELAADMTATAPTAKLEAALSDAMARQNEINVEIAEQHARRSAAIDAGDSSDLAAANLRLRELPAEALFARRTALQHELDLAEARVAATANDVWQAEQTLEATQRALVEATEAHEQAKRAARSVADGRSRAERQAETVRATIAQVGAQLAAVPA